MSQKNSAVSKRAIILFTNHPSTDAARKKFWFNLQKSISIFCLIMNEICNKILQASHQLKFELIISSNVDPANFAFFTSLVNRYFHHVATHFVRQSGRDFGERLTHTIRLCFENGYEKVLVIGNDSIDLDSQNIFKTFQELDTNDIVLGPSLDCGVYLIGLSKFDERLFQNVQWYSAKVFAQIQSNAIELGNKTCILRDTLPDFDDQKMFLQWFLSKLKSTSPLIRVFKHLLVHLLHKKIETYCTSYRPHLPQVIWQKSPPSYFLIYS